MKKPLPNIRKFLDKEIDPAYARRAKLILENLEVTSSLSILEIGCGRGFYEKAINTLYPQVSVIGVDSNKKYLEVARKNARGRNIKFLLADATGLPFSNNSFDRVICSEVLEHIKEDEKVLQEIYRVLKPGGLVLITVPNKNYPFFWDPLNFILERIFHFHLPSKIWWLSGIWADHIRLYQEKELREKLESNNFKIDHIWQSTHFTFPFSHHLLYGLGKNLVERGFLGGSFNRFEYDDKPSLFLKIVKLPFSVVDKLNKSSTRGSRFVNIVVKARK